METVRENRERAEQHRPDDPVALAGAVHGLAAAGLPTYDIAAVLRIGTGAVSQMLRNP